MPDDEIVALKDRLVEQLSPLQVYLFGSYAYGTPNPNSDYDFYIVMDDAHADSYDQTVRAYKAIRHARTRPVDILVGTKSIFEEKSAESPHTIESEVFRKGILLYDATGASAMA